MVTSPEESRLPPGSLVRQFIGEIRTIPQAKEILLHTLLPQRFLEIPDRMDGIQASVNTLQGQVGNLRGESYERECARRIKMVMVEHLSNVIQADRSRIDELLVTARQNGRLTEPSLTRAVSLTSLPKAFPSAAGRSFWPSSRFPYPSTSRMFVTPSSAPLCCRSLSAEPPDLFV